MKSISHVLALWEIGVLSSKAVVAWADEQILKLPNPRYELIQLSLDGPELCLKRSEEDFPSRPITLSFPQKFCVKCVDVDFSSDGDALCFAQWAARAVIGEDLEQPLVHFGYRLDHVLNDCFDQAAVLQLIRRELLPMLPACKAVVIELFGQLPFPASNARSLQS